MGPGKLKIGHSMSADEGFRRSKFGGAGHMTTILKAENRPKVDKFELVYLSKYRY